MNQQYSLRLEKIEEALGAALPEIPGASWMARSFTGFTGKVPLDLVKTLTIPGRDLLDRGGKRWRPLLMTLVCEALGGGDSAIPLTPLVEFPHNASLIHDDIEDNSDERRGKPAVHLLYGMDTAINAGSFLYFLPLSCVDRWEASPERKNMVYAVWAEYLRRLHLGQGMDIAWHRDFSSLPKIEEYMEMCRLKTGVLARMAAVLGVYIAGNSSGTRNSADERDLGENLGRGAESLGVGFQILDDVKNLTTGNPGKKRGDDIVEGKKSLPILLYLHQQKDRVDFVSRCFSAAREKGARADEVEELISALEGAGVIEEARQHGLGLIDAGEKVFGDDLAKAIPEENEARKLLSGFVGLLL
ncbi:polyprenyl synthetase family protein [Breznakiella homolactica]|uniref:Polyprenyl synthetase family protein n=1 Tax=Breznakiella homolactica TaxID=2798577 RepID=A0A7T8B9L4_9SPIR|nr:polyprenyl synthetase family protein [Breznakiella homolactica]QQO09739.1 polyprenyl synthetase family protein [Breznakiella homolactica]